MTNSRQRLLATLNHQEPDRVPFDLGSTQVTGIHAEAYAPLRSRLGLPPAPTQWCDVVQQLARPDDDFVERLGVDVRGLYPLNSHNWKINPVEKDAVWEYVDEWGITQHRPRPHGLYYSAVRHPLSGPAVSGDDVRAYPWPDTGDPQRIAGLYAQAQAYRAQGQAVAIKGVLAGLFEMTQRLRGMENCLMDMASNEPLACAFFDQMLELKLAFWEMALPQLGEVVDVISEADDYGTQASQIISPRMFRRLIKPRLNVLIGRLKQLAPHAKVFFHSCGNVRPLLPDFIELGIDILNPVHIRATGMEPAALKRDFGRDLVFWGGGIDTQDTLPNGTPQAVRDEVRRNIEILAPGGGYVFSAVHNLQADVPTENILAMCDALREIGGRHA